MGKRWCAHPGCPRLASPNSARCALHATRHETERRRLEDQNRPNSHRRGYDREYWRQRWAALVRAGHRCEICGSDENVDVHHVTPLRDGGTHDQTNLQVLCRKHHNEITARSRRVGEDE